MLSWFWDNDGCTASYFENQVVIQRKKYFVHKLSMVMESQSLSCSTLSTSNPSLHRKIGALFNYFALTESMIHVAERDIVDTQSRWSTYKDVIASFHALHFPHFASAFFLSFSLSLSMSPSFFLSPLSRTEVLSELSLETSTLESSLSNKSMARHSSKYSKQKIVDKKRLVSQSFIVRCSL